MRSSLLVAVVLGVGLCALLSLLPDLFFTANYSGYGFLWTWIVDVAVGGLLGTTPDTYYPIMQEVTYMNQSLKSVVLGMLDGRAGPELAAHKRTIVYFVYLVYGLAALAVLIRSVKAEGALLWGGSIVVISMVLLSPVSSKSHFVVLLLPHMAIMAYLIKHREARRVAVPLLCASFALNTLSSRAVIGRDLSIALQSFGCIAIGTLLLLAVVAVIVFRDRGVAKPRPG
jgi:hypothetical protein